MTDDNRELEDALRRREPAALPAGLRERILVEARLTRALTRRRWTWRLGVAAVILIAFFVGAGIENAQSDASRALLAGRGPSTADREADRIVADISGVLDGNGLAQSLRQELHFQLAMKERFEEGRILRQMTRGPNLSTQE